MDNKNFYSNKFDITQESKLKQVLEKDNFKFKSLNHAFWSAQNTGITVNLYKSGKILVQGKNIQDFLVKYLNQEKTVDTVDTKENIKPESHKYTCWIGTDESGKGDYFGPLVIAGVLIDQNNLDKLNKLGIKDSKQINDVNIRKIAPQIKENSLFSIVTINPAKYNQLYSKFKNLNNLLAWGHARVIENILEKKDCPNVISDKFGNESLIKNALLIKGKNVNLEQRVRAEDDIAVAAASILARNEFIERLDKLSREYNLTIPKGASSEVKKQAQVFINKYGFDALQNTVKLHFKTTLSLTR